GRRAIIGNPATINPAQARKFRMLQNNMRVSGFFKAGRATGLESYRPPTDFRAAKGLRPMARACTPGVRARTRRTLTVGERPIPYCATADMAGRTKWKSDPWSGPGETQRRP